MDSQSIRREAAYLLTIAEFERDEARAANLRHRAIVLEAMAEHFERTGHYVEVPYLSPQPLSDSASLR